MTAAAGSPIVAEQARWRPGTGDRSGTGRRPEQIDCVQRGEAVAVRADHPRQAVPGCQNGRRPAVSRREVVGFLLDVTQHQVDVERRAKSSAASSVGVPRSGSSVESAQMGVRRTPA